MGDLKDTISNGLTSLVKKQVTDLVTEKIGSDVVSILELVGDKVKAVAEEAVADHEERCHGETAEAPPEAETEA